MNPYAAPGTPPREIEDEIAAAAPPTLARLAGGVVTLAGLVVALTGGQSLAFVTIRGPLAAAPWVLVALGLGDVALGVMVFRARLWGALGAVGLGAVQTLATGGWLLVTLSHRFVSLYALGAPCMSLAAAIMALLALGPCQRCESARARLREQGMSLGI